jgi:acyl-CoA synthetase (AMP-forming)/AMP-acid ligase II
MISSKSIAAAVDLIAQRVPSRLAVVSPFQKAGANEITYGQLSSKSIALAGFLSAYGYEKSDILMCDLPNVSENLLLQLACNRLGVHFATAKNLESMAKFTKVKGAVTAQPKGFLAETNLPLPYLDGEYLENLIHKGGLDDFSMETNDAGDQLDSVHAYYNSLKPFTNGEALQLGEQAANALEMMDQDKVCVSVTLCHAFGMGSAVCSGLLRGATLVLPAVGGIQGCGVPSQRAEATFQVLENQQCTLLFADTHTLKALPTADPARLNLRGGICKVGSGSTFLYETIGYGGVQLKTMGTPK